MYSTPTMVPGTIRDGGYTTMSKQTKIPVLVEFIFYLGGYGGGDAAGGWGVRWRLDNENICT